MISVLKTEKARPRVLGLMIGPEVENKSVPGEGEKLE